MRFWESLNNDEIVQESGESTTAASDTGEIGEAVHATGR